MGCVTCECYCKQDAFEQKICWTWRNHVSRVSGQMEMADADILNRNRVK